MITTNMAVVVEGKYDKIHLSRIVDAPIICTDGFGIYSNEETVRLIRHYAASTGIIILTDSDSAGFQIRSYIKSICGDLKGRIVNVYIPDVYGKERRKTAPSKEGKLGVEGISEEMLIKAFEAADIEGVRSRTIDKMLMYELGLSGRTDSAALRRRVLASYDLPGHLSANAMADALNCVTDAQGLAARVEEIQSSGN